MLLWNAALTVRNPDERVEVIDRTNFYNFSESVKFKIVNNLTERYFGVSHELFHDLLGMLDTQNRSFKISPEMRVAVFLKYIREGRSQNSMAHDIGISQSSVCRIIKETCAALCSIASRVIKLPSTRAEIESAERSFYNKKDMTGRIRKLPCFGVLDGKHFALEHPPHSGSLNANYKGFFSFNTLMICDADLRVIGINSDAQLFRDGPLGEILANSIRTCGFRMQEDEKTILPPFILSDNGFGLSHSVMQPYRQTQMTPQNHVFNQKLCAVRVKIENLFGVLTSKFRIFRRELNLDPQASRTLVVACSVLHNLQVGPVRYEDADDDPLPRLGNPYANVEEQRTALKMFLLS